jgi:hypothetical protein
MCGALLPCSDILYRSGEGPLYGTVSVNKGKGKGHPTTGHEGPQGEMYSTTLPSTSALVRGWVVKRHAPAVIPPRKTRYPLYRRLGRFQGRSGRVRKISPPTGFRSPDRPARSESLYRLSYPDPLVSVNNPTNDVRGNTK